MAVAGSVSVAAADLGGGYTKYTITWTSDAAGVVTENPVAVKRGRVRSVTFTPGAGGVQPTDLYDATVIDAISGGFDFIAGQGANLSNVTRKVGVPVSGGDLLFFEGGNLYPTIANAGNAKQGTIALIVGP